MELPSGEITQWDRRSHILRPETNIRNLALLCHHLPFLKFCIPVLNIVPDTQSSSNTYESDSNPSSTIFWFDDLSKSYLTHRSRYSLLLHVSGQF